MAYQIISDGSCDLDPIVASERNIQVVPFYVSFDDNEYMKEIEEIPIREFYKRMVEEPKRFPKSSLPSVQDYMDAFKPCLEKGLDILCICITTKFSGSYNSAMSAAEILNETLPNQKIAVIDSAINTVAQGLLVLEAARMRDHGYSYEEVIARIEQIKETGRIFFTIGNMDYLIHGGRVGKVMGAAVSTLRIKPIIVLKEGEIFPIGISRNRKNSLKKVIEQVKSYFQKGEERVEDYQVVVGYGYDYEEAVAFRDEMYRSMKEYGTPNTMDIYQIGATIGVHTGPHPLGIGLMKYSDV